MDGIGLFSNAGIFGWEKLEELFLVSLINADPTLLRGSRGAAKTFALKKLCKIVLERDDVSEEFGAWDCPNTQFEEFIGFPNPHKMMTLGEVEYIKSKLTAWNKLFGMFTELNRCDATGQSKFLQVILDRTLMGEPTKMRWVYSDINPLTYPGTSPFDPAVADRFSFLIDVPDLYDMADEHQRGAISSYGDASLLAVKEWDPKLYDSWMNPEGKRTANMAHARGLWRDLKQELFGNNLLADVREVYYEPTLHYLQQVVSLMRKGIKDDDYDKLHSLPSGRRTSFMHRSILTRIAIRLACIDSHKISKDELSNLVLDTMENSITLSTAAIEFDMVALHTAHNTAIESLQKVNAKDYWAYRIQIEPSPAKQLAMVLLQKMDEPLLFEQILEEKLTVPTLQEPLYEALKSEDEMEASLSNYFHPFLLSLALAPLVDCTDNVIPVEARAKIAGKAGAALAVIRARIEPGTWRCNSAKVGASYLENIRLFEEKLKQHPNDPRWIAAFAIYSRIGPVARDAEAADEDYWAEKFTWLREQVFGYMEALTAILDPVVLKLRHASGLKAPFSAEVIAEKAKVLSRVLRGLPEEESVTIEATLAMKEAEIIGLRQQIQDLEKNQLSVMVN